MPTIRFAKMHGLGNDFMVIDAVNQSIHVNSREIRKWADRHLGIGFDQLLIVEPSSCASALFKYRIFNADGAEVEQCGNGARCLAVFAHQFGLTQETRFAVETKHAIIQLALLENGLVQVDMGAPIFQPERIPFAVDQQHDEYALSVNNQSIMVSALSMGNPHAVIFVDDLSHAPVAELGQALNHSEYFPAGVNVGFAQIIDQQRLQLRVWERGVGETMACGSGACAAAVAAIQVGKVSSPVTILLPSGDLFIAWAGHDEPVLMTGPATYVYQGEI